MTSKEKIVEIINKYLWKFDVDKLADELFEEFEKDLEVLELLRPHLINSGVGKFDNVEDNEILHLKLTLSGKEYNTIKGWLENDT